MTEKTGIVGAGIYRRKSNVDSVDILEDSIMIKSLFGKGTENNPYRIITEIFSMKGKRICIIDDYSEEQNNQRKE